MSSIVAIILFILCLALIFWLAVGLIRVVLIVFLILLLIGAFISLGGETEIVTTTQTISAP